jgi:hypothetical protein
VPGTLTSVIWSGRLPEQRLRQHLFSCSECFTEYRTQLAAYQQKATSQTTLLGWHRWRGILNVKLAFVFAALVITSFGGWLVWRLKHTPPLQEVVMSATPKVNSSPPIAREGKEEKAEAKQSRLHSEPPQVIARSTLRKIELDDYAILRNVNVAVSEEKTIHLAPEPTRLHFVLPEGSTKGRYTVMLIDAFGHPLSQRTAVSPNGKTLTVSLDLRWIKANSYRLQIAHGNEAPAYYPVTVTEKRNRNK